MADTKNSDKVEQLQNGHVDLESLTLTKEKERYELDWDYDRLKQGYYDPLFELYKSQKESIDQNLLKSVKDNDLKLTEVLISCYGDLDIRDQGGKGLLEIAAEHNNMELFELLLENGANPYRTKLEDLPGYYRDIVRYIMNQISEDLYIYQFNKGTLNLNNLIEELKLQDQSRFRDFSNEDNNDGKEKEEEWDKLKKYDELKQRRMFELLQTAAFEGDRNKVALLLDNNHPVVSPNGDSIAINLWEYYMSKYNEDVFQITDNEIEILSDIISETFRYRNYQVIADLLEMIPFGLIEWEGLLRSNFSPQIIMSFSPNVKLDVIKLIYDFMAESKEYWNLPMTPLFKEWTQDVMSFWLNHLGEFGIDLDRIDDGGQTALIAHTQGFLNKNNIENIQALIKFGADVNVIDYEGNYAYDYFLKNKSGFGPKSSVESRSSSLLRKDYDQILELLEPKKLEYLDKWNPDEYLRDAVFHHNLGLVKLLLKDQFSVIDHKSLAVDYKNYLLKVYGVKLDEWLNFYSGMGPIVKRILETLIVDAVQSNDLEAIIEVIEQFIDLPNFKDLIIKGLAEKSNIKDLVSVVSTLGLDPDKLVNLISALVNTAEQRGQIIYWTGDKVENDEIEFEGGGGPTDVPPIYGLLPEKIMDFWLTRAGKNYESINMTDAYGYTPLIHHVTLMTLGHLNAKNIEVLIKAGADPTFHSDYGYPDDILAEKYRLDLDDDYDLVSDSEYLRIMELLDHNRKGGEIYYDKMSGRWIRE